MKKYWPILLVLIGVLLIGAIFIVKSRNKGLPVDEEESIPEVPFAQRPVVTLTPTEDGHYLKLQVSNLVFDAETLEYVLEYNVATGELQGVSGKISLSGQDKIERELLLGSESSGKFRYDEGVEEGSITFKYRNAEGKSIGKMKTQFHLQKNSTKLTSLDSKFEADLLSELEGFSIVMDTLGLPESSPGELTAGPYGVFTSSEDELGLEIINPTGSAYLWDGQWVALESPTSEKTGIFIFN